MKHIQIDSEGPWRTLAAHHATGRLPGRRWALPASVVVALVLFVATIAMRWPWLGDATYHEDESFYLIFAQAMHHGAIPYVDIWDRKPMGLFALYWLIALLPGNGILAYKAVAGLFAFATAFVASRIARRLVDEPAACCVGLGYLACLPLLLGAGGQSPIFYNLFIALAVLALLPLQGARAGVGDVFRRGCVAMVLCGLALTIKPTVVVESVFLGIVAAHALVRHTELPIRRRLAGVGLFALLGALPTMVIFAAFALGGHLQDYWFATVVSMGLKTPQAAKITVGAAVRLGLVLLPLWGLVLAGLSMFRALPDRPAARFLTGWLLAAIGGFLLIPNFWDHYALPLLPPLLVVCAPVFARAQTGKAWFLILLIWCIFVTGWPARSDTPEHHRQLARIVATINHARQGGCLYVFEGLPALYTLTDACRVTSRIFPQHLSFALERSAIGVDPAAEMRRIVARRPAVVALSSKPLVRPHNWETRAILMRALRRDYRRIAVLPISEPIRPRYFMEIWALPARSQTRPGS